MTQNLHFNKLIKLTLSLIFIFQINLVHSQVEGLQQDSLIKKLKVEFKECYTSQIINLRVSNYSKLTHKTSYNKTGDINTLHSYDSIGISRTIEYKYNWDNKLSQIKTTFRDTPDANYFTKYEYEVKGKNFCERFIRNGKMDTKTDFFYNKKEMLTKKEEQYFAKKKPSKKKHYYYYNYKNQIKKQTATGYTYVANEMFYDLVGNHTQTFRINRKGRKVPFLEYEYDNQNKLSKKIEYKYSSPYPIKNEVADVKTTFYTYLENGLIASEKVLQNEILTSFKEYEYTFFDKKN